MKKQTKKQIETLALCIKVAEYLKERNINWIMPIKKNSIIPFTSNRRLCSSRSLGGSVAHFHQGYPPRICIKQQFLEERKCWNYDYEFGHRVAHTEVKQKGSWAIIDLMCHELAHHRTKGHGKRWYAKYLNLKSQMALGVISGDFYGQRPEEVN